MVHHTVGVNNSYVLIDDKSPFVDLCHSLMRSAGYETVSSTGHWALGVPLIRGLDRSNVHTFKVDTDTPGPVVAIVTPEELANDLVATTAGNADAYCIVTDTPVILRATIVAALKRWEIGSRLRESESRFRFIAQNAGDVIWTWNLRSRRFEFISAGICRLRGLSVEEALEESLEQSLTPESSRKAMEQLARGIQEFRRTGQLVPVTDVYEQRHKNGSLRFIEITTTLLLDPEGEPEKVIGVSRDATERIGDENALKKAIGERDTLLRELGHRIKNTLALTSSLLSLARSRVRDEEDGALFDESQTRVHAMALLYDRLLNSSSQSDIDLGDYIRDLCADLSKAYTHEQSETIAVQAETVIVDSRKAVYLGLVINEALTNALKYGRATDNQVTIRVTLWHESDGSSIVMEVVDEGSGLPPGFDPETSDGLGFQLIRSLAEQLGGRSTIQSSPGAGTLVRIEIPVA